MSIEEIIQLIQAVSENKLTSFELEEGNMKLSLKCKKEQPQIVTVAAASMPTIFTISSSSDSPCRRLISPWRQLIHSSDTFSSNHFPRLSTYRE